MTAKAITKSILTLFVTTALLTSCSSTQTVSDAKTTVQKKMTSDVALVDTVKFVDVLNNTPKGQILDVDVIYSATTDRDLVAELKDASGTWIGGGKVEVSKGSGTTTLKIWSKNPIASGNNYQLLVSIRPSGANWKETIKKDVIKPFTIK